MKVLLLSSLYPPNVGGGAEIILQAHASALQRAGIEVVVLSIGPERGLAGEFVDGIRVWRAGYRNIYFHLGKTQPPSWQRIVWHLRDFYNPLMKRYIYKIIEAEKPDIVSCHNLAGWSVSAWDALAQGSSPVVQVLHDQYLLCPKSTMFRGNARCSRQCGQCRILRSIHRAKSQNVRAVIGVSHFILGKLLSHGYFRETRVKRVIHNARVLPVNYSVARSPHSDHRVVFGYLGTLAYIKGVELLIDRFIAARQPTWHLLIAGTGKENYEAMLKNRCAGQNIEFAGYCRPQELFTKVDISVVPSLWEDTFPGVVFESLLYGVPVIGSRRGGIPEMIEAGDNGMVFDPDHSLELSHCMEAMANNLDQWRARRKLIQEKAKPYGDELAWTNKWIGLFKDVLDSRSQ